MKTFTISSIITILLIVVLLGACHRNNQYSTLRSRKADVKAIRTWFENYTKAINSADIERILSYQSNDICYYPPNQPYFSGKENLRKWFLSYFNYFNPQESYSFLNLNVYGDFAYVIGKYSVQGKIKQTGEEFKDNGKFTNFFNRKSDGNWICTKSIWNSDNQILDIHSQILDDFSGTWLLDLSKSITPQGIISSKLVITQKGNNLCITRTNDFKNKPAEESFYDYTIGIETQNLLKSGIFTTTTTLSPGKQTFTITESLISEINGTKQEHKRITSYKLTAKGGLLYIISDDLLPKESLTLPKKGHSEMVYTKFETTP
jgi:ketosteroid isomerase-like protein